MAPARSSGRSAHQLPPGPNPQGRAFVEGNQRARILDAVTDVAARSGYGALSVTEITAAAGVSRRTFYDLFADRHEAFLAALDQAATDLEQAIDAASAPGDDFPASVRRWLTTLLAFLTAQPRRAELLLVESLAAGPEAIQRRRASLLAMADRLRRAAERLPADETPPPITAEAVIGGLFEVIYSRLVAGELDALPDLAPDLAYSILQPYLGHTAARAQTELDPTAGGASSG